MDSRRALLLGAMVSAILFTYSNSLKGAFFFDDSTAVLGNPFIEHMWPLSDTFRAPPALGLRAVELNPAYHDAWLNLGIEYFTRKEFPLALQALVNANTLNPRHSNAHLMRGRTLVALNQLQAARDAFQTALACDAKNAEAARELRRLQP